MQKSYFHRAVLKRAEESRREPTKAEENRSEPNQQKGGMFILRCSATVGYTRYAISTIERTFSGGCTIEGYIRGTGMSKQSVCKEQSYEAVVK
jgi:hypothetical protein